MISLGFEPLFKEIILLLLLHNHLIFHFLLVVIVLFEFEDFDHVFNEPGLDVLISCAVNSQGRRSVDFKHPRLLLLVYKNIEPKQFKTSLVVLSRRCKLDEGQNDDHFDFKPQQVVVHAVGIEVVSELGEAPLSARANHTFLGVAVRRILVNGSIREVGELVVKRL